MKGLPRALYRDWVDNGDTRRQSRGKMMGLVLDMQVGGACSISRERQGPGLKTFKPRDGN